MAEGLLAGAWHDGRRPQQWQATLDAFIRDRQALIDIVNDPATDLYAKFPWSDGQTVMREILVVTDHNAYHVGEFSIMRQAMATWGPGTNSAAAISSLQIGADVDELAAGLKLDEEDIGVQSKH